MSEVSDWDEQENDVAEGVISDWVNPSGKGPARFKLGRLKCQVWPKVYESQETNPTFTALKGYFLEEKPVRVKGQINTSSFWSEKAGKEITTTSLTVYEADPLPDGAVPKSEPLPLSSTHSGPPAARKSGQAESGSSRLSKEEWAEKDRLREASIDAWAAVNNATTFVAGWGQGPVQEALAEIEYLAPKFAQIARNLKQVLGSGSTSSAPSTVAETSPGDDSVPSELLEKLGAELLS